MIFTALYYIIVVQRAQISEGTRFDLDSRNCIYSVTLLYCILTFPIYYNVLGVHDPGR